jgi:hypothetical protein
MVKVYGKRAWGDPNNIDVMAVCEKKSTVEPVEGEFDVAFTNPFYFRVGNQKDPGVLQSKVHLTLSPAKKATIEILDAGKKIRSIKLSSGKANFTMPVNGLLKIIVNGYPTFYRSLYLDYLPHRQLIEELASGRWKNNYNVKFNPGEVPWPAFNYNKTKSVLSEVNWSIKLRENERDKLYADILKH